MLADILALDVYRFLLVFARVGTALMILPPFAIAAVGRRARGALALLVSFIVLPIVAPELPPLPATAFGLLGLLGGEIIIGIFLGMLAQFMLVALHTAGTYISMQAGMANALIQDAVSQGQASVMTSYLTNIALLAILATDLHHLALTALVDSYGVFTPGAPLPVDDFAHMAARKLADGFRLGAQLAAPAIAFSLILQGSMGILNRMLQQLPIFFIALPLQQLVGLALVAAALPLLMVWFLRHYEAAFLPFVAGG